jgi:hypothetical protein
MTRIEYTLSFENYLEMTSSRREKRDFRIAAIFAIAGFFSIAAGYLLLKLDINASFLPGGLLLASGLLLTFVAIILGFLVRPKQSRPNVPVLRREYDLFHADKRAIEFDENGWRLFWYEGEDVRPWSCLRQVYDLNTLFVLGTETTHYWLPKTALHRDGQLDQLKTLAESFLTKRQELFQVPLRPSAEVYVLANMFHSWRRYLPARFFGYGAATLIAYWIFYSNDDVSLKGLWRIVLIPFFLFLCEILFYFAKYCKEDWSKASENAEIMSDCIGYKTKMVRWITEYRQLVEVREIPGALLLYFGPDLFYTIPKNGFSPGQIDQFRDLVGHRPRTPNVSV